MIVDSVPWASFSPASTEEGWTDTPRGGHSTARVHLQLLVADLRAATRVWRRGTSGRA